MADKSKAVVKALTEEQLAFLRSDYPVEQGVTTVQFPRLNMYAKDQTEESKNPKTGKKEIKVISEAGEWFTDIQGDEIDEDTKKKEWERAEIGSEVKVIVLFKRKQLRMFDQDTEKYTSSPIYDEDDQTVPLFCERKQVGKGTPAELKAEYEFEDEDGKVKSKLKDERVLYVLMNDEIYQLNLRGSSMYAFKSYERDLQKAGLVPSAVVTKITSESQTKGTNTWNQMVFVIERNIEGDEISTVMEKVKEMRESVAAQMAAYGGQGKSQADKDYEALDEGK